MTPADVAFTYNYVMKYAAINLAGLADHRRYRVGQHCHGQLQLARST